DVDALRAKLAALSGRLAEPAIRAAALLAFGREAELLGAQPVEEHGRRERAEDAELDRRLRRRRRVVAAEVSEQPARARVALERVQLLQRVLDRVVVRDHLHERGAVLEALDLPRVESARGLERLGRLDGAERLRVDEREVVARRHVPRVALERLLVVLL